MKMKKSLLLAITAGAVAPVAAFAQQNAEDVPVNDRSSQRRVVIKQDGTWYPLEGSAAPFTPRATVTVYDSFPTVAGTVTSAAAFNGISLVGDDISFAGTPWATAAGTIVQMEIPARHYNTNPVPPASGPTTADLVIEMWDEGSLTASPMGAGTPFNTTILEGAGLATVNAFPVNAVGGVFIFTPTTPIVVPGDGDIFLTYSWRTALAGTGTTGPVLPGPTSLAPFATSHKFSFYGWFNNNPANSRGATDEGMGFDMNGDGVLQGGAQVSLVNPGRVANVSENRRVFLNPTATPPAASENYGVRLAATIRGTVDSLEIFRPAVDQDMGTLANGETISNIIATGSTSTNPRDRTAWFRFNVAGDITDAASTWLDIDMEPTSAITTNPTTLNPVMALFKNNGEILLLGSDSGIDNNDGTGLLAQLSFGIGLRAANGVGAAGDDIRTFDGIDGELLAADGPFYLGVTSSLLASDIEDGWNLEQPATATGSVQVRFRTNVNGPLPLDPAVPPFVNQEMLPVGGIPGDPISLPGFTGTTFFAADPGYVAYKFTTCKSLDANDPDPTDWLDLDFDASQGVDHVAFLFNSSGFLVAENDDGNAAGGYFKPQLSFGNAGPRAATNANAAPYTGQNGALPAGTYYAIVAFFGAQTLPTDDRFHVRPFTPNSALNVGMSLLTGLLPFDCSPTGCDTIDFNGNQVFPEDQDVIDFFFVLAGGECPTGTCQDIDFNNNGVFPEDQDVIDFFNVLAGGTCP